MIIVAKRDEAKRLIAALIDFAGVEHLRHSLHAPRLGVKRDFDEVAVAQGSGEVKHAAGGRDRVKFAAGAIAVIQQDRSRH